MRTTQLVTRLRLFGLMICGLLLSSPSYSQFGLGGLLDDVVNEVVDGLGDQSDQSERSDINFGDDSSRWALDGECDDPRFQGSGMAATLVDEDRLSDATDCRDLFNQGQITFQSDQPSESPQNQEIGCNSGDCINGQGTYTYEDGNQYVGGWMDGQRNGQGTFTYANGLLYVGEWMDDLEHGQGTLTAPDGYQYVGEYRDGQRNGQGTHTWPNGQRYVGGWRNNQYHGQGTMTLASGSARTGIWEDGEFVPIVYESYLAEFEATNSGTDLVMYLVFAETCAEEFLLRAAVAESLVEVFDGMIRRGIAEERFESDDINDALTQYSTILAGGMNLEQQKLCEVFPAMEAGFFPPPDRF